MNIKRKYLRAINQIRRNFNIDLLPSQLTRTVSFRIFPKKDTKFLLDRYFNESSEAKYRLLLIIFERFKNGNLNLFDSKIGYSELFKGTGIMKELKERLSILKNKGIEAGLRGEDTIGLLKSFQANTLKRLYRLNSFLKKIITRNDLNSEEKEFFEKINNELANYFIFEEGKSFVKRELLTYQNWQFLRNKVEEIIKKISDFNYERNQQKLSRLEKPQRLPKFPLVEIYPTLESYKERYQLKDFKLILEEFKKELEIFKNQYLNFSAIDENLLMTYLNGKIQKLIEKEEYVRAKLKKQIKNKKFREKFLFWVYKDKPSVNKILESLNNRLQKQEKHLFKKPFDVKGRNEYFNTLFVFSEIVYVSQKENTEEAINNINNEITRLKSKFQKGKPTKDTFTIAGFGWTGKTSLKPQYGCTLIVNKDYKENKTKLGIILFTSDSAICYKDNHPKDFYYIVQTGGSKKPPYTIKKIELKEGHLEKEKDPLSILLSLHFGKSYARRILFHKEWGFLTGSSENRFFLSNARFKRIKEKPGDEFEYYVDITFQYQNVSNKELSFEDIKRKLNYVIGIDRGEKIPLAYAVVDLNGEIVEKGLLGEKLSQKLLELQRKRVKGRRLRSKIRKLQETILHQSLNEILYILAKYPGVIVLECLRKGFGKERSLIPKRTYTKSENFFRQILEFTGLPIDKIIIKVNPKDTSSICPKCNTNFNEIKKKLKDIKRSEIKNLKDKILEEEMLVLDGLKIKIPSKWEIWVEDDKTKSVSLEEIKNLLKEEKYNETKELIKTVTPRIKQEKFVCLNPNCGFEENADIVGAINIAKKGLEKFDNL